MNGDFTTQKGDFTAKARLLWISAIAVGIGALCAVVALVLQRLIFFFTNLFYYQHLSFAHEPELWRRAQSLGLWAIVIPILGGLIIGLLARYGSERIRGHGIPEALEAILIGRSRMSPKVAILKPLSSAISIGSGGPFGAEGPIIMTGGACGSIIAQVFNLTAAERKTLLVAGAAGGMTATFGTPAAAVLLAVELLLFEWKPRSLFPVAVACAMAVAVRPGLGLEGPPLFPIPLHPAVNILGMGSAAVVGVLAGIFALLLTLAVYTWEDLFHRLPFHWMWWPALGGLAIGIGGYFQPRALGVGYDIIEDLLRGQFTLQTLLLLIVVKSFIWSCSLGSGTSGGVLAPLLIMGGAVGSLISRILPGQDASLWALVGMASIMGGTMRSPFTGIVFALELTWDIKVLPPLLIASFVAYAFTVLFMKRSILTEKVARRGYHISREYSVDPLERSSIGDVMSRQVITIPAAMPVVEVLKRYFSGGGSQRHQGYPVVDEKGTVLGVLTRTNLLEDWVARGLNPDLASDVATMNVIIAYDLIHRAPITAFAWESCRTAAERMAEAGVGRMVVVADDNTQKMIGIVTRSDLLKPRAREVEEEIKRERFIGVRAVAADDAED
ncbi:MAG TPA: chloride channel protein [Gemmataceae bacterium]|nr:chloride channel protein [Gemmataceae bacterium]